MTPEAIAFFISILNKFRGKHERNQKYIDNFNVISILNSITYCKLYTGLPFDILVGQLY